MNVSMISTSTTSTSSSTTSPLGEGVQNSQPAESAASISKQGTIAAEEIPEFFGPEKPDEKMFSLLKSSFELYFQYLSDKELQNVWSREMGPVSDKKNNPLALLVLDAAASFSGLSSRPHIDSVLRFCRETFGKTKRLGVSSSSSSSSSSASASSSLAGGNPRPKPTTKKTNAAVVQTSVPLSTSATLESQSVSPLSSMPE